MATPGPRQVTPPSLNACRWCQEPAETDAALPPAFCWTKMQAEAGQSLASILWRKELERSAGRGIFFWGIGNSLGRKVYDLVHTHGGEPKAVFSTMKSTAKPEDAAPDGVVRWTAYIDEAGLRHALPDHVLVLSRARTASGPKTRHYALVCRSSRPLAGRPLGKLPSGHFRNLGSARQRIGASQVTAVIEHHAAEQVGPTYDIDMVANLAAPYCVQLLDPVPVPADERERCERSACDLRTASDWMAMLAAMGLNTGGAQQLALCSA